MHTPPFGRKEEWRRASITRTRARRLVCVPLPPPPGAPVCVRGPKQSVCARSKSAAPCCRAARCCWGRARARPHCCCSNGSRPSSSKPPPTTTGTRHCAPEARAGPARAGAQRTTACAAQFCCCAFHNGALCARPCGTVPPIVWPNGCAGPAARAEPRARAREEERAREKNRGAGAPRAYERTMAQANRRRRLVFGPATHTRTHTGTHAAQADFRHHSAHTLA